MQRLLLTISFSIACCCSNAQSSFTTIVPLVPVEAGESFTVQYVLKGSTEQSDLLLPDFKPCRLISGPDVHTVSNGATAIKNYVFTLLAPSPGRYRVPGIMLKNDGQHLQSNEAWITVIARDKKNPAAQPDENSDYYLAPGENVQDKIRKNLYVSVSVNKNSCYAGEPVIATFRLYSRLQSKSDIVKNPGFYGFTVYDMISLDDKLVTREVVNGRWFDVHTIRKVQLYPLQPGIFTIDAMHVKNKIEFSRSEVNKKAEQEIIEGVTGGAGGDEVKAAGVEIVETELNTTPVNITVKPLPEKNKPAGFSGTLGQFEMQVSVSKEQFAKNEEGILEVIISGKGNFVQMEAPVINWPSNLEGFEPVLKDSLDKTSVPLQGSRTFRYAFVTGIPGSYVLPPVRMSYFDPSTGAFRSISSNEIRFTVSNTEKPVNVPVADNTVSIASANKKAARIAVIIVVALVLLILFYWGIKKKEKLPPVNVEKQPLPTLVAILKPAGEALGSEGNEFYKSLHFAIWNFLSQRFEINGSNMNRLVADEKMKQAGVDAETTAGLFAVLSQCEQGLYTGAALDEEKEALLKQAGELMEKVEQIAG